MLHYMLSKFNIWYIKSSSRGNDPSGAAFYMGVGNDPYTPKLSVSIY